MMSGNRPSDEVGKPYTHPVGMKRWLALGNCVWLANKSEPTAVPPITAVSVPDIPVSGGIRASCPATLEDTYP